MRIQLTPAKSKISVKDRTHQHFLNQCLEAELPSAYSHLIFSPQVWTIYCKFLVETDPVL